MEMMERGHAGSEWMYTRNAGPVCVCLCVNGFSVKVKLYQTEIICTVDLKYINIFSRDLEPSGFLLFFFNNNKVVNTRFKDLFEIKSKPILYYYIYINTFSVQTAVSSVSKQSTIAVRSLCYSSPFHILDLQERLLLTTPLVPRSTSASITAARYLLL